MSIAGNDLFFIILLVCLPLLAMAAAILFTIQRFFDNDRNVRLLELRKAELKDTRSLKLQAYERLILFLERINPSSLIGRNYLPDSLSQEMQYAIVQTINAEFEHNLSQQLYVSNGSWTVIVNAKNEIIKTIAAISAQLPPDSSGAQLSRIILETLANINQPLPTEVAINILKEEAKKLLQ